MKPRTTKPTVIVIKKKRLTTHFAEAIVSRLRAAQEEKWRRARALISSGHSPKRISDLVDLPVASIRIVKQAGDW